jgi:hypothetical protein
VNPLLVQQMLSFIIQLFTNYYNITAFLPQGSPWFEMEVTCDCGYIDMFTVEVCNVDMAFVSADNGESTTVSN